MSVSSIPQSTAYNYQAVSSAQSKTNSTSYPDGVQPLYSTYDNATLASNSSTKWGFKIDESGFFGSDFNKAAGLPENIKIHQTMMAQAENYSKSVGGNIDPIGVISKAWNLYKTVAGGSLDPDNDGYMSQTELDAMPKSYVSKGGILDGAVSVQKTQAEYDRANNFNSDMKTVSNDTMNTGLKQFSAISMEASRENYKLFSGADYGDNAPSDKISVGELFGEFFYGNVFGEMTLPVASQKTKSYNALLDSGQDIKSYISDKFGSGYMGTLTKQLGTTPDGTYSQSLVDSFFEELDKNIKEQYAQYKASFSNDSTNLTDKSSEAKNFKNIYANTQKLSSGSLVSALA